MYSTNTYTELSLKFEIELSNFSSVFHQYANDVAPDGEYRINIRHFLIDIRVPSRDFPGREIPGIPDFFPIPIPGKNGPGIPGKRVYVLIDLFFKNDQTYSKKFKIIIRFDIIPECSPTL